jgi:hypothetical protein
MDRNQKIYNILTDGVFQKYIKSNRLNIFQKFIFRDLVRYRLFYLFKNENIRKELKNFFENNKIINDGWIIYKSVYTEIETNGR